jgi:peptidyl-prolyl cis-trans isomerase C/foldase protein PrsA
MGLALLGGLLLLGCPADPRDRDPLRVLAQVGDKNIEREAFVAELMRLGVPRTEDQAARHQVAKRLLDRLIEEELLIRAADEAGIKVPPEEVARAVERHQDGYPPGYFRRVLHAEQVTPELHLAKVARNLRIEAFLKARLADLPMPTEEDAQALFDKEGAHKELPAQVRVRQVLVETEEEARHIREQVKKKSLPMDQAAARYSKSPEAKKGGDLGWFSKGQMPEAFDVVFDLETEAVSEVVSSPYGFHVFEVVDKRPARQETFVMARERLISRLRQSREEAAIKSVLSELKKGGAVKIHEEALKKAVSELPAAPPLPQSPPQTAKK